MCEACGRAGNGTVLCSGRLTSSLRLKNSPRRCRKAYVFFFFRSVNHISCTRHIFSRSYNCYSLSLQVHASLSGIPWWTTDVGGYIVLLFSVFFLLVPVGSHKLGFLHVPSITHIRVCLQVRLRVLRSAKQHLHARVDCAVVPVWLLLACVSDARLSIRA